MGVNSGRLQMYLVLGALALSEFRTAKSKHQGPVSARRKAMFNDLDLTTPDPQKQDAAAEEFKKQVTETLTIGGFNSDLIDNLNWNGLQNAKVWEALKTLNDNLQVMDQTYDGTDCPCIAGLVKAAIEGEKELDAAEPSS